jgi:hypothetical protein
MTYLRCVLKLFRNVITIEKITTQIINFEGDEIISITHRHW